MSIKNAAAVLGKSGGEAFSQRKTNACRENWKKAMAAIALKPKLRIKLTCQWCGVVYEVEPYREKKSKYCSHKCGNKAKGVLNAEKIGNQQRYSGDGKSYVKMRNRHLHRTIAEESIGRPLVQGEIVHHIDGNRRNNDASNLRVMSQSDHVKLHLPEMRKARKEKAGY